MRATVELKPLLEAVSTCMHGTGSVRPILACLHVRADGRDLRLVSTDAELAIEATIPAAVERGGEYLLPAKLLRDVLAGMGPSASPVLIAAEDDVPPAGLFPGRACHIVCGQASAKLCVAGDAGDFPPMLAIDKTAASAGIEAALLRDAISKAAVAIPPTANSTYATPAAITWDVGESGSTLAATDGKRMAVAPLDPAFAIEQRGAHWLPARAAQVLLKLLKDIECKVDIAIWHAHMAFSWPGIRLVSRLVDAKALDYRRLIPKEHNRRLIAGRKEIARAIRAVVPIARPANHLVWLNVGRDVMRISAASREDGAAEAALPIRLEGEPIRIAFNVAFVSDFLDVAGSEEVVIDLSAPHLPGVLRPVGGDYTYVIMPMAECHA